MAYLALATGFKLRVDELDTAIVYLNSRLVGTWEGTVNQVVHIENMKEGDTLTVRARTDVGGLGNSSIDIKDDNGLLIENVQSPRSREEAATFVDPERHLAPPTIATINITKK